MKIKLTFLALVLNLLVMAQHSITGKVIDKTSNHPLEGVTVSVSGTAALAVTDKNGQFIIKINGSDAVLRFSDPHYEGHTLTVTWPQQQSLLIFLKSKTKEMLTDIEEVTISTGYQKIPKERATGSFSFIGSKLLQQQVTTNIIDRLPVVGNGLSFTKGLTENGQLMVRGLSTMQGPKTPLIILDNFPYDGDLANINPNLIESVTILKDAAASSIWGARAANGVIVITTKSSRFNQPVSVSFTANTTLGAKPDLSYSRQISSSDFIDVETQLFKNGYYNSDINSVNHPVLTPVIDLLDKEKNGLISHEQAVEEINRLRTIDVRDQYKKYMYMPLENRQYAINISGGSSAMAWSAFLGLDDNSGSLGEKYRRINARLQNTWKLNDRLTVSSGVSFTGADNTSGRSAYNSITMKGNWKIPYLEFADAHGNALVMNSILNQDYKNSLRGTGLLDWNYYPLTDWQYNTTQNKNTEVILNAGITYKILKGLEADFKYQYLRSNGQSEQLYDQQSYYARNYINSFAKMENDGRISFVVPKGGIITKGNNLSVVNSWRGQLNYNNTFGKHAVSALLGAENRENDSQYDTNKYYGYNPNDLSVGVVDYTNLYPNFVTGSNSYIEKNISLYQTNIRFVSLFGNASYTYDKRYIFSASARRDASNLFGLKTNDQWNPFWSLGLGWDISNEKFYDISPWLPYLKLRGSYGFNGNIDPAMVAVTTIAYNTDLSMLTGTRTARIDKFFNPNLRWEMMRMINGGVDFATKNNRISGSVEVYSKKGNNLFGEAPIDYTTGITSMLWNVAGMKGRGMDVELKTRNVTGNFSWNSIVNYSMYRDEVTDYYIKNNAARNFISQSGSTAPVSGIVGLPVYAVFAYKWAGLDPNTGDPQGYFEGEVSKEYSKITSANTGIEDLKYFGSAIPTTFESFINSLGFKQWNCDIGMTFKFGYWFRRSSVNYTNLISSRDGHSDYASRWQKPGDELYTNVPSNPYKTNSERDNFYNGSEVLVEKGDHIRLQYINLGYNFSKEQLKSLPLKNLQLYCNINNVGIIWRANKSGLDPDYNWGTYSLRPVSTFSIGLNTQF